MKKIKEYCFILFICLWTVFIGLIGILFVLTCNKKIISNMAFLWGIGISYYLKLMDVNVEVEGQENLPQSGPFIIACKHQSAWETVFFLHYLKRPVYVIKKELLYIPVYGWYLKILDMIPVKRGGISAIKKLKTSVRKIFAQGRPIVIFPEGTRVSDGQDVEYKPGVYVMHSINPDVPIVPVALNSGKFWVKNSFILHEGTIKVKILKPIVGSMKKNELLQKLKNIIDEGCKSI